MKKYLNTQTLVIAGAFTFATLGGSIVSAQSEDVSQDRETYREMKREHRKEMKEMRQSRRAGKMMQKIDANEDGQVDLDEYLAHAQERFNNLDIDGSGFVTQEEAQEAMRKMRAEHKARRLEKREERDDSAE